MNVAVALARDRRILYAAAFLRALATGMMAVLLTAHLVRLGFTADAIGYVVGAGLTGNAVALAEVIDITDEAGRARSDSNRRPAASKAARFV